MQQAFDKDHPLLLAGCGNMGRAMAEGWLQAGLVGPDALYVIDPAAKPDSLPGVPASQFYTDAAYLPDGLKARALVIAVKPQVMDQILPGFARMCGRRTLAISVAAGVTIAQLRRGLGAGPVIVRAMPNTPAAVGAGITGLIADAGATDADRSLVGDLLSAVGKTVWVEEEGLMNAVTALSGSGPAYVFHLVEAMAAAGEGEGLGPDAAMALARQTVIGAARLMEAQADVSAAELRQRVTSPGGTTAAALGVLMEDDDGLSALMARAIEAARKRGEELGG